MKRFRESALYALFVLLFTSCTAVAQWLSIPLPGTPRTSDGKPNLNALTPRAAQIAVVPPMSRLIRQTTDDKSRGNGRNYLKRMVNEYQSAAEIIAEVPARYI
jgi:hypothetical protein